MLIRAEKPNENRSTQREFAEQILNKAASRRTPGHLDTERLREVRQFVGSRVTRYGAAGRSHVFCAGLRSGGRPLGANFLSCEFTKIDLVNAAEYRLRVFLSDFRDGDSADFH